MFVDLWKAYFITGSAVAVAAYVIISFAKGYLVTKPCRSPWSDAEYAVYMLLYGVLSIVTWPITVFIILPYYLGKQAGLRE